MYNNTLSTNYNIFITKIEYQQFIMVGMNNKNRD
jgi:hypothetical protein